MNREDFLKQKISATGKNQKTIASELEIPYSTLRDMLSNVGSARVDNVIKLCRYLKISVSELDISNDFDKETNDDFTPTEHEKNVIRAYRQQPIDVQSAIDRILDIDNYEKKSDNNPQMIRSFRAAHSADNHEPEIVDIPDLSMLPETDEEF